MKTGKNLTLLLLSVVFSFSVIAQEKTLMAQLVGKTWYQVDEQSGKTLHEVLIFENDGNLIQCTMSENRHKEFPQISNFKYHLSDTPNIDVQNTLKTKCENGKYLIIKGQSKSSHLIYNIALKSSDQFYLIHNGNKKLFVNKTRLKTDSVKGENSLNKISGKIWRQKTVKKENNRDRSIGMVGLLYFTENSFKSSVAYTKGPEYHIVPKVFDFYLSNTIDGDFNYEKHSKGELNGKYLILDRKFESAKDRLISGNVWEILYLTENMLVFQNVNKSQYNSTTVPELVHKYIYVNE